MEHLITPETMTKAIARAFERRCHVRRVEPEAFIAHCPDGHDHLVRFTERGGKLFAECIDCPSNLGGARCYHIADALALRQVITDGRTGRTVHEPAPHAIPALFYRMHQGREFYGGIQI